MEKILEAFRQQGFVVHGCVTESVRYYVEVEEEVPHGRILAIRDASDEVTESCPAWEGTPSGKSPFVIRELELEIDTGLRHGFLYTPLPEWVDPVLAWTRGETR